MSVLKILKVHSRGNSPTIPTVKTTSSVGQFPLNLDKLLMSTFCLLLMGKSFEMDFFLLSSKIIHQLFKVSILSPDMALEEISADQDS